MGLFNQSFFPSLSLYLACFIKGPLDISFNYFIIQDDCPVGNSLALSLWFFIKKKRKTFFTYLICPALWSFFPSQTFLLLLFFQEECLLDTKGERQERQTERDRERQRETERDREREREIWTSEHLAEKV